MRKVIKTSHQIQSPIQAVWSIIAQGDKVESWLPIISESSLAEGNRRTCRLQDGSPIEETILKSDSNFTFLYAIDKQESFPIDNAVGIIRLAEGAQGGTELFWDLEFDVEEEAVFNEFRNTVEQVYAASAVQLQEISRVQATI